MFRCIKKFIITARWLYSVKISQHKNPPDIVFTQRNEYIGKRFEAFLKDYPQCTIQNLNVGERDPVVVQIRAKSGTIRLLFAHFICYDAKFFPD